MNVIAELLNKTDNEYNIMVFDVFLLWCDLNSNYNAELQVLVSNDALFNWFKNQMKSLELEFYNTAGVQNNTIKQHYENIEIYYAITSKCSVFTPPKTILSTIKRDGKTSIINHINNN